MLLFLLLILLALKQLTGFAGSEELLRIIDLFVQLITIYVSVMG